MLQQEPNYKDPFKDGKANKITFWLGNDVVKVPMELFVNPGAWKAKKNDKVKWMNKIGQDMWSEVQANGKPNPDDFKEWHKERESFFQCPRGIDDLIKFIQAWANVATDGIVELDTVEAISNGNVAELKEMLGVFKNNRVRVLVSIRDEKYPTVYTRYFGRINPESNAGFTKAINADYGDPKGEYSIEWKEFKAGVHTPDALADGGSASGEDNGWMNADGDDEDAEAGDEIAGINPDDIDDDLPF